MFYLCNKRFEDGTICAAYGLLNAGGRQLNLVTSVLVMLADNASVAMTRNEGDIPIDVTCELKEAGWVAYDCLALEEGCFRYDVKFTPKRSEGSEMLISIYSIDGEVTIEVTGEYEDEFDDPCVQPFLPIVDAVENFAHYLEGYRVGVACCSNDGIPFDGTANGRKKVM